MRHEAKLHRKGGGGQQDVQLVREEQGSRSESKGSGGPVKAGIGRGGVGGRVPMQFHRGPESEYCASTVEYSRLRSRGQAGLAG